MPRSGDIRDQVRGLDVDELISPEGLSAHRERAMRAYLKAQALVEAPYYMVETVLSSDVPVAEAQIISYNVDKLPETATGQKP
jgi:hypothetical protein